MLSQTAVCAICNTETNPTKPYKFILKSKKIMVQSFRLYTLKAIKIWKKFLKDELVFWEFSYISEIYKKFFGNRYFVRTNIPYELGFHACTWGIVQSGSKITFHFCWILTLDLHDIPFTVLLNYWDTVNAMFNFKRSH